MDTPDWRELIKDLLVNPRTPIEDGKVLALKEGGGIKFMDKGRSAELTGKATTNLDALEVLTLMHGESGKGIYISPGNKRGDQTYQMMVAAIADYHGFKHNFRPKGQHRKDQYEPMRQIIYAQLDDKYGEDRSSVGLQPVPPSKLGKKICISIGIASGFLVMGFAGFLSLQPEDLSPYERQLRQNIYLGKDSKEFSQIIRAFKTKHPQAFARMMAAIHDEKNKDYAFSSVLNIAYAPNNTFQKHDLTKTRESVRLYVAMSQIGSCQLNSSCRDWPIHGWPSIDRTLEAFLTAANQS